MSDERKLYWLWLYTIKGIGPKKFRQIKQEFGTIENAYSNRREFNLEGFPQNIKEAIRSSDLNEAEKVLEFCIKNSINIILEDDEFYPAEFKDFDHSPVILFAKGNLNVLKTQNKISMVGTREPTYYGKRVARELASLVAQQNIVVVSGMARGIDTFCHMGALENGTTIAVLGCGVDVVYPKENYKLYNQIVEKGCVISEFLPKTLPDRMNFPQRNRIVAMLSPCLVVIEAAEKSGTFSTVDFALEMGKEVFAVPGNIFSQKSSGTNRLIKEGARIVCSYQDFLEDLKEIYNLFPKQISLFDFEEELSEEEDTILKLLDSVEETHIENLILMTNWSAAKVASVITSLEIKGKVVRERGNIIVKI
ncbi:DNA-processing protein DprA [Caldicellulosiruptor naganoensis]|uniref:DNA-processing protein DprA n=1 Tax=Caldicellulosiruptor naganoensis TaxID=29324 RepID=A0ABY7BHX4_9FIRM|nr:DNA-processing protein DprA [Caldicellulosiruptor naganoensis]WAM32090.1 DNA-processing protein DprA [Caldicellulosiruptor naganoensis]